MDVPHSGNKCSAMCTPPCEHADCWQCLEVVWEKQKKNPPKPKPVTAKALQAIVEQDEQTTITRAALTELVARIPGVTMDWNNGDPIFTDRNAQNLPTNDLYSEAVRSLGTTTANSMDRIVRSIVNGKQNKAEAEIKAQLKASGATDDDIAAAVKLLAEPKKMQWLTPPEVGWKTFYGASLISAETAMDRLSIDTEAIKAAEWFIGRAEGCQHCNSAPGYGEETRV